MKRITIIVLFLFLGMHFAFSQGRTITGTVTSATDGSTIPGVQVVVQGTSIGVTTNIDGVYNLNVPASATTLEFTFVGMKKQVIEISGRSTIDLVMEDDLLLLGEVIVVGYGTRGKNEITGSTVQVGGEELAEIPVVSVDQALQGKVAGLTISSTSGTPGSEQNIRIRGTGSITAGNEPLFVIDGVPMISGDISGTSSGMTLSPLAAINSADIESITVLKDASATSAYGARGSNGVIVITTKKGKSGKTKFNFSSTYGFQNTAIEGMKVLNGDQRKELFLEGIYNTYGADYGFSEAEAYDFMVANNLDGTRLQDWDGTNYDWREAVQNKNAPMTNINISATGGDEESSFYASLGYNKTEATTVGSDFERITGVFNYKRNFRDNILFSTSMNVSNTIQNGFLEQSAYFGSPTAAIYFMPPWVAPYDENGEPNINTRSASYNWLYLKDNDIKYNDMTRAITNTFLEWEIIENLKFKSVMSMDYNLVNYKSFQNRHYADAAQENGYAYTSTRRNFNWVTQNSLDYNWVYKENHRFSFKALMEFQKNKLNWIEASGENFPADGLTNVDNAGANKDAGSSFYDWKNLSYLGMVNYNYLGKYIADFTYRREGSSRFAPGLRYGDFWSTGAAWNMSQEDFLADVDWISNLRVRASYGKSGSSAIGINSYQALLAYDADYADQGAVYPSQFGNGNLTWEKNKNYDIGVDFAFLESRISGSLAYFNKETYDLLQDVPLSRTSGHADITQNVGSVVNKGLEAIVNFDLVRSDELNVNLSVNIATLDNEVTKLAVDGNGDDINIQTGTRKVEVGHPIYEWNMRTWAGVDPSNGLPQWYLNGVDGEVTNSYYDAEEAFQGASAIPTYSGGVNLHVDYKGFFMDVNAYFAGGHKIFEDWSRYTHHNGYYPVLLYNGAASLMDRWQQPGDITDQPLMLYDATAYNSSRTSTRFLYDGDYVRLKDLVFGYDFSQELVSKLKLEGLRVFVRGSNLFTWVKDDRLEYDPEVRADGFTYFTAPPVKSVIFGVNVNF